MRLRFFGGAKAKLLTPQFLFGLLLLLFNVSIRENTPHAQLSQATIGKGGFWERCPFTKVHLHLSRDFGEIHFRASKDSRESLNFSDRISCHWGRLSVVLNRDWCDNIAGIQGYGAYRRYLSEDGSTSDTPLGTRQKGCDEAILGAYSAIGLRYMKKAMRLLGAIGYSTIGPESRGLPDVVRPNRLIFNKGLEPPYPHISRLATTGLRLEDVVI